MRDADHIENGAESMIRRMYAAALALLLTLCAALNTGCTPIPLREVRPPERAAFLGQDWRLQTRYLDVRNACKADSLVHAGVRREDLHQWLGPPNEARDFELDADAIKAVRGAELFGFRSTVEEFYILSIEGPFTTTMGGDDYLLAVRYGRDDRVEECHVYGVLRGRLVHQFH